jgi:hypothetical protein
MAADDMPNRARHTEENTKSPAAVHLRRSHLAEHQAEDGTEKRWKHAVGGESPGLPVDDRHATSFTCQAKLRL